MRLRNNKDNLVLAFLAKLVSSDNFLTLSSSFKRTESKHQPDILVISVFILYSSLINTKVFLKLFKHKVN